MLGGDLAQCGDLLAQVRDQVVLVPVPGESGQYTGVSAPICGLAVSGFRWAVRDRDAGRGSAAGRWVLSLAVSVFAFTAPTPTAWAAATAGVSHASVNGHGKQPRRCPQIPPGNTSRPLVQAGDPVVRLVGVAQFLCYLVLKCQAVLAFFSQLTA
ncbi:Uncharacterised protein [Mycobacteroides abscessus subsp. abscessus]|nr:Uncharacterised protein [Mycobacteroides abscessus subsp. abscessus]SIJ03935.1 Uncharacterised protein [Mycobacteroides abscessus subsp. abscessus]SIK09455.1 Uncharacterised protein [Mycobacteroides abscessus subsp. abscessus]SIK14027.1 Uncharacterised protein [Mycobacteroides abscessus subsp. abscessus]SIM17280.1 Uncharacterised protein [Mycobacteroides abscessus subsp. abscessus]